MGNGIERAAGTPTKPVDTKAHVKAETGLHLAESTGGAGLKVGVDKNFKLNESIYLKGQAEAGLYSNGKDAAIGLELHSQKKTVYPFAGVEAQYYQNPKQKIDLYSNLVIGNSETTSNVNLNYKEDQLHLNGKLGLHAETKNGRFTFEGGVKVGEKFALDGGYDIISELRYTYSGAETAATRANTTTIESVHIDTGTEIRQKSRYAYQPGNSVNVAGFAEAEMKLGKGISLIANGEYGNNMKQGTVGIRYTF